MSLEKAAPQSNREEAEEPDRHPSVVESGPIRESSGPATAGVRSNPRSSVAARMLVGILGSATVGLAVFVLGWSYWHRSHQASNRGHWDAVARGRDYLRRGRPDLALQMVNAVRDEAPGSGEAMTIAGLALLRLGEYRGARLSLERALKLQPNQFETATTLAELNFGLGNGRRGLELLQSAARIRPDEFRVWLIMGKVLHDLGDIPKAIQAYERALKLNPDDREALVGLIRCLMSSDLADQAEALVNRALEKYPEDPVVLGFAACVAFDANRLDQVIALADRTLARDPKNFDALLARARTHLVRSQWEQALPDAERAVSAHPSNLGALQLLQKIETRLGLTERARFTQARRVGTQDRITLMNQLNEEIARHPEDPKLVWKMGQTALESGSFLLASRCFEAAIALDPNFEPARASLTALRAAQPDLARSPGRPTLFPAAVGNSPSSSDTSP
jgi:tetratricopeptide (TPR) repeat protein